MKIGLVDVDGHNFPNIPLMKLSTWHKAQGDQVEWAVPTTHYDTVYQSKVFTFTPDNNIQYNCDRLVKGGTGYDLVNKLSEDIEHQYPDYELYGVQEAYGFLSRGCPRHCPFCIVSDKEGRKSYKVADLSEFWRGQKTIVINDPNLLACKEHMDLLQQLVDSKSWIDINQGFDIRLMNDEIINKIKQMKLKLIHFAWDGEKDSDLIIRNLQEFRKQTTYNYRILRVYVLCNYNTDFEYDKYRVYKIKELGFDPFVMVYDRENASPELKKFQRWVDNKFVFRSVETFEEYDRNYRAKNGRKKDGKNETA